MWGQWWCAITSHELHIQHRPVICLIICDFMLDNETGRSDFTQHITSWPQSAMWRQRHAVWILQNYESFIIPTSAHSQKHKRHTSCSSNTLMSSSIIELLFLFVCLFFSSFCSLVWASVGIWWFSWTCEYIWENNCIQFCTFTVFHSMHDLQTYSTRHLLDV